MKNALFALMLMACTSCALGSGGSIVSVYAMHAKESDGLTGEAEDKLVERLEQRLSK